MQIHYKFVDKNVQSRPFRADKGSAGFDLYAVDIEEKNGILTVHTGIAVEIPYGYAGFLFPRSSVYKTGLSLANSVGVIDSSYRGEIMCKFRVHDDNASKYEIGERCCQLVIMPVPDVDYIETEELSETLRGVGGFGSSGN